MDYKNKHETTNFDFKEFWPTNINDTVYAMLNIIDNDEDAFIFIGIEDKDHKIVGVNDKDLKDENYFNNNRFNIKPNINISTIQKNNKSIQCISIWNRYSKPYFKVNNEGQMDSIIMIRNNSASTKATPYQIEELYKYRFKINESIFDKFKRYLMQYNSWSVTQNNEMIYLHNDFMNHIFCYYDLDPLFSIKAYVTKFDDHHYVIDLYYTNQQITNISLPGSYVDGIFLPFSGNIKHHNKKNDIWYNVCYILTYYRNKQIMQEDFEKICQKHKINWQL